MSTSVWDSPCSGGASGELYCSASRPRSPQPLLTGERPRLELRSRNHLLLSVGPPVPQGFSHRSLLYSTAALPRAIFPASRQPAASRRPLRGWRNSRGRAGHPGTAPRARLAQSERPPLIPRHSGSCGPGPANPAARPPRWTAFPRKLHGGSSPGRFVPAGGVLGSVEGGPGARGQSERSGSRAARAEVRQQSGCAGACAAAPRGLGAAHRSRLRERGVPGAALGGARRAAKGRLKVGISWEQRLGRVLRAFLLSRQVWEQPGLRRPRDGRCGASRCAGSAGRLWHRLWDRALCGQRVSYCR